MLILPTHTQSIPQANGIFIGLSSDQKWASKCWHYEFANLMKYEQFAFASHLHTGVGN